MKTFLCGAALALLSTAASAVTLDFETLPGGGTPTYLAGGSLSDHTPYLVGDIYAAQGVVFSSQGDPVGSDKHPIFGTLTGSTGSNIVVQDYKRDVVGKATFNIRADFASGIDALTADVFSATDYKVTMSGYDSAGTLLGSVTSGYLTFGTGESVSLSGIGTMSYVVWESSSPYAASVGIDNLDFAPVPLPAGAVLLGSALLGFGALRRRAS